MKKKSYFEIAILFFVILLGVLLRVHAYLLNNWMYPDEVVLGVNLLLTKDYSKFLFAPLVASQAAPGLFLLLSKLSSTIFGWSNYALRLIPLISGLLSIVAFYFLCEKTLSRSWTKILALLLFCTNFQLLFYSQFFKPYSSDVLIAILVLLVALSLDIKKITLKQALGLGVLSSVAFYFSFPVLFVVSGVLIVNLIFYRQFTKTLAFLMPNIITIGIYFYTVLNATRSDKFLKNFWANGFDLFHLKIYHMNYDFFFVYCYFPLFFLILFIAGVIWAYKSDKFKALILISPIVTTFFAALIRVYPFERRLILFLLPIFIIFGVMFLDKVKIEKKVLQVVVIALPLVFFINYFVNFSKEFIFQINSYKNPDVLAAIKILEQEKVKQEKLYVYYSPWMSYLNYKTTHELPPDNLYISSTELFEKKDLFQPYLHESVWILVISGIKPYQKITDDYIAWLYKHAQVKKDVKFKSARLIKAYL